MAPTHEEVSQRAYTLWKERGCPDGSPEVDWHRAEAELTAPSDFPPGPEKPSPREVAGTAGRHRTRIDARS